MYEPTLRRLPTSHVTAYLFDVLEPHTKESHRQFFEWLLARGYQIQDREVRLLFGLRNEEVYLYDDPTFLLGKAGSSLVISPEHWRSLRMEIDPELHEQLLAFVWLECADQPD